MKVPLFNIGIMHIFINSDLEFLAHFVEFLVNSVTNFFHILRFQFSKHSLNENTHINFLSYGSRYCRNRQKIM